jgi:threonine dehydrogenase-like Zn-dependent dehydrogenase
MSTSQGQERKREPRGIKGARGAVHVHVERLAICHVHIIYLLDHIMDDVEALLFDVFGTVVDWHGSVSRYVQSKAMAIGSAGDTGMITLRSLRITGTPMLMLFC